jgi:hypothetical protein
VQVEQESYQADKMDNSHIRIIISIDPEENPAPYVEETTTVHSIAIIIETTQGVDFINQSTPKRPLECMESNLKATEDLPQDTVDLISLGRLASLHAERSKNYYAIYVINEDMYRDIANFGIQSHVWPNKRSKTLTNPTSTWDPSPSKKSTIPTLRSHPLLQSLLEALVRYHPKTQYYHVENQDAERQRRIGNKRSNFAILCFSNSRRSSRRKHRNK